MFKDLFKRFIDAEKVESAVSYDKNIESVQERIIVVLVGEDNDLFSGSIIEELIHIDLDGWVTESLNPVIVLSSSNSPLSVQNLEKLISRVYAMSSGVRMIASLAIVKYGLMGTGTRMSYGSRGMILTKLIKAAVSLPSSKIYVNVALSKMIGLGEMCDSFDADNETFLSVNVGEDF